MPNPYVLLGALVGAIALAVTSFFYGEHVEDLSWQAKWSEREMALAKSHAKTTDEYREREQVLQGAIALMDKDYTAKLKEATYENASLRSAIDTGAKRLLVRARCPAAPGLPQAAANPGVDHGAGAELDAAARPDYYALREGLTRVDSKLSACQSALSTERKPTTEGR